MNRPIEPGCIVMVKTSKVGNAGRTGRVLRWVAAGDTFEIAAGAVLMTEHAGWLVEAARSFNVHCTCAVTGRAYQLEAQRCDFPPERLLRLDGGEEGDASTERQAREEGVPA